MILVLDNLFASIKHFFTSLQLKKKLISAWEFSSGTSEITIYCSHSTGNEGSHGVSISGHQSQVVVLNSAEKYFGLLESIIIK